MGWVKYFWFYNPEQDAERVNGATLEDAIVSFNALWSSAKIILTLDQHYVIADFISDSLPTNPQDGLVVVLVGNQLYPNHIARYHGRWIIYSMIEGTLVYDKSTSKLKIFKDGILQDLLTGNNIELYHNELLGIQGGNATEQYHLTQAEWQGLTGGQPTTLHTHNLSQIIDDINGLYSDTKVYEFIKNNLNAITPLYKTTSDTMQTIDVGLQTQDSDTIKFSVTVTDALTADVKPLSLTDAHVSDTANISWSKISKVGSSLYDLEDRPAEAINVASNIFGQTDLQSLINDIDQLLFTWNYTGKTSGGTLIATGFTLNVDAGEGYITTNTEIKRVSWNATNFDLTTYAQGGYWVYVDVYGTVHLSSVKPDPYQTIMLGYIYRATDYITVVWYPSNVNKIFVELIEYLHDLGPFVISPKDLIVIRDPANPFGLIIKNGTIRYGFETYSLSETNNFLVWFYTTDNGWVRLKQYENQVPTRWYNDTTGVLKGTLTGTLTFTNGSTTVTGTDTLFTTELQPGDLIWLDADGYEYAIAVASIASDTQLELEKPYPGPGGTGTAYKITALKALTDYTKHYLLIDNNNVAHLILGQEQKPLSDVNLLTKPDISQEIEISSIDLALIKVSPTMTEITQQDIEDIRPLPFAAGRVVSVGGGVVVRHGDLLGLENDDHPQYLLANGARSMTGNLDMGGFKIINLADPVGSTDAVNKGYVDNNYVKISAPDTITAQKDFTGGVNISPWLRINDTASAADFTVSSVDPTTTDLNIDLKGLMIHLYITENSQTWHVTFNSQTVEFYDNTNTQKITIDVGNSKITVDQLDVNDKVLINTTDDNVSKLYVKLTSTENQITFEQPSPDDYKFVQNHPNATRENIFSSNVIQTIGTIDNANKWLDRTNVPLILIAPEIFLGTWDNIVIEINDLGMTFNKDITINGSLTIQGESTIELIAQSTGLDISKDGNAYWHFIEDAGYGHLSINTTTNEGILTVYEPTGTNLNHSTLLHLKANSNPSISFEELDTNKIWRQQVIDGEFLWELDGNTLMRLDSGGNLRIAGFVWVFGADYAEIFEVQDEVEVGDIIGVEYGSIKKYHKGCEVLGVVTDKAGVIGNAEQKGVPVALMGQVKVKKEQAIHRGHWIYTIDFKPLGLYLGEDGRYYKVLLRLR